MAEFGTAGSQLPKILAAPAASWKLSVVERRVRRTTEPSGLFAGLDIEDPQATYPALVRTRLQPTCHSYLARILSEVVEMRLAEIGANRTCAQVIVEDCYPAGHGHRPPYAHRSLSHGEQAAHVGSDRTPALLSSHSRTRWPLVRKTARVSNAVPISTGPKCRLRRAGPCRRPVLLSQFRQGPVHYVPRQTFGRHTTLLVRYAGHAEKIDAAASEPKTENSNAVPDSLLVWVNDLHHLCD